MISIDPAILFVMGEVMLALLVGLGAICFWLLRNRKRDKSAISILEARLKKNSSSREQMFEDMIKGAAGDGEEEVEKEGGASKELAKEWVAKENKLYGHLINMYATRDSAVVSSLDKLLHEYTSNYLDIVVEMRKRLNDQQLAMDEETQAALSRMEEQGKLLSTQVTELKEENARLAKELQNAEREIDQTVREYASAFRHDGTKAPAPVAAVAAAGAAVATAAVAAGMDGQHDSVQTSKAVDDVPEDGAGVEDVMITSPGDQVTDVLSQSEDEGAQSRPAVSASEVIELADDDDGVVSVAEEETSVDGDVIADEAKMDVLAMTEEPEAVPVLEDALADDEDSALADLMAELDAADADHAASLTDPEQEPAQELVQEDASTESLDDENWDPDAMWKAALEEASGENESMDAAAPVIVDELPSEEEAVDASAKDDAEGQIDDDLLAQLQAMNMGDDDPNIEDLIMGSSHNDNNKK